MKTLLASSFGAIEAVAVHQNATVPCDVVTVSTRDYEHAEQRAVGESTLYEGLEVAPQWRKWVREQITVAHNIAHYDRRHHSSRHAIY